MHQNIFQIPLQYMPPQTFCNGIVGQGGNLPLLNKHSIFFILFCTNL